MTEMEIIEGNKLIAEFDGWLHIKTPKEKGKGYWNKIERGYSQFDESGLQYHSSWDWLMPACNKWDSLEQYFSNKEYHELCENLDNVVTLYTIDSIFEQMVENIKWHNQNKAQ